MSEEQSPEHLEGQSPEHLEGQSPEPVEGQSPEHLEGQSPELVEGQSPEPVEGLAFCINHPGVETGLRCNRCGNPICARCAVRTPVGYRCKQCIKQQQAAFYTGLPVDYIIAAVVSLPLAAAGAYLASLVGFFFAFFIGPAAGVLAADLAWRAVGRRRSRYLWLVVCSGIVVAAMGVALYQAGAFAGNTVTSADLFRLDLAIYVALAVSAAYSRLRLA
jgi:hypothetical protein